MHYSDSTCCTGYQHLASECVSRCYAEILYIDNVQKSTIYHVIIIKVYTRLIHVIMSGIIMARVLQGLGRGTGCATLLLS